MMEKQNQLLLDDGYFLTVLMLKLLNTCIKQKMRKHRPLNGNV
uniref:Uncharacterized protein n=1 Tax=Rhizophora mucronata TaxID=61149 RepID=A0A2P2MKX3_RHIMU